MSTDPGAIPDVVYLCPSSDLHGGIRVLLEQADGLARRGWDVLVAGPDPAPDWHESRAPYTQRPIFAPGGVPAARVVVATFYTTVAPALASGAGHVFHLCQGWEGSHREYAHILGEIDAAYRLPVPKLLVSDHLRPVLEERYDCRCHVVGQAIDHSIFVPGRLVPGTVECPARSVPGTVETSRDEAPKTLRIGVVGPFGIRPKGIGEALEALRNLRSAGLALEVHRASSAPLSAAERDLGVTDTFHHRLDVRGMARFYRGLDALVFPSHDEEGFGLPVLEAMACGVPVAASDIRPLRVLPDDAIVRFVPGDIASIESAVRRLAEPERRTALRAAGLVAAQSFTQDAVLDRIEAAFAAKGVRAPAAGVEA